MTIIIKNKEILLFFKDFCLVIIEQSNMPGTEVSDMSDETNHFFDWFKN